MNEDAEKQKTLMVQSVQNPVFADTVIVQGRVQSNEENRKFKKAGIVRLSFVDSMTGRAVSDVVLKPPVAESLVRILRDQTDRLEKMLSGEKLPEDSLPPKSTNPSYVD